MKIEDLEDIFNETKMVCPPDEYELRQRILLWETVRYLIERDKPTEKQEGEKTNG